MKDDDINPLVGGDGEDTDGSGGGTGGGTDADLTNLEERVTLLEEQVNEIYGNLDIMTDNMKLISDTVVMLIDAVQQVITNVIATNKRINVIAGMVKTPYQIFVVERDAVNATIQKMGTNTPMYNSYKMLPLYKEWVRVLDYIIENTDPVIPVIPPDPYTQDLPT